VLNHNETIWATRGREAPIIQCYALVSSGATKLKSLWSAKKLPIIMGVGSEGQGGRGPPGFSNMVQI